jgi:hypothetical protein
MKARLLAFGLIFVSSAALADAKLVSRARLTIMEVSHSLSACTDVLRAYHSAYEHDEHDQIVKVVKQMVDCETQQPKKVQPAVTALREYLKAAGKSEQPLKEFMIAYRKALSMLGPETSNLEAAQYAKILASKGEAMVVELEW